MTEKNVLEFVKERMEKGLENASLHQLMTKAILDLGILADIEIQSVDRAGEFIFKVVVKKEK